MLDSEVATVTITIIPANGTPIANHDSYELNEDTLLTVIAPGVLANDADSETNYLNSVRVNVTTNGILT